MVVENEGIPAAAVGLLGMGSWVQGFRCFPWLGMQFFLKDELGVSPSALQLLQSTAILPMVGKPVYGVVSDSVYVCGGHRLPYLAAGAALQATSWLLIALLPDSHVTASNLTVLLLLAFLGAAVCEVARDAIAAEAGRPGRLPPGHLQSLACMFDAVGGVLGNLMCSLTIGRIRFRSIFVVYATILIAQFTITVSISEHTLNLPKQQASAAGSLTAWRRRRTLQQFILSTDLYEKPSAVSSIRQQLKKLSDALRRPEISHSLCWFAASYAMVPNLGSTMFYYQSDRLGLGSSVVGLSRFTAQVAMFCWGLAYKNRLKNASPRRLISTLQAVNSLLIVSDALFVGGMYRRIGLPDSTYVVVFAGVLRSFHNFKMLPFSVLMAHLCPPGCEGSLMAFAMSAIELSTIASGYLGVALATLLGISAEDFSGLGRGILVQAGCVLLPVYWSSWINDHKVKKEE